MGFCLIEDEQPTRQEKPGNGRNAEGQIKIDLSVESYEGDLWKFDNLGGQLLTRNGYLEWRSKRIKPPSLYKIQRTLKATGAIILRTHVEGRYTVIDYSA